MEQPITGAQDVLPGGGGRPAIRAVLFDMDGLMFDTERISAGFWERAGEELGCPIPRGFHDVMRGRNANDLRALFAREFGGRLDFDEGLAVHDRLRDDYVARYGVPVKPGLRELLCYLRENGYARAVATSTGEAAARGLLAAAGVIDAFDCLCFGDRIERGKPEPDIFLAAAAGVGVPPAACMVLEDSPTGILAAHRAGCAPVMVPDLSQPAPETEALLAARCETLFDVIPLLERMAVRH